MTDHLSLGSSPIDEDCVSVDSSNAQYFIEMKKECEKYKGLLIKKFPIPQGLSCFFSIKRFEHDFGPYLEVCINFNPDNKAEVDFAFNEVDNNLPEKWSENG